MSVCPSVCPFGTKLSESSYFSFRSVLSVSQDLSQVSVSSLTYFVVQTEPKILSLVEIITTLKQEHESLVTSPPPVQSDSESDEDSQDDKCQDDPVDFLLSSKGIGSICLLVL